MGVRKLPEKLSVNPQITAADMAAIKAAGYRAIICNRPDGEGADQPSLDETEARYGLVQSGMVTDQGVAAFGQALAEVQRRVLTCCQRTGTRFAMARSLHEAKKRPSHEILAMTKAAGCDSSSVACCVANAPADTGDVHYKVVIVGAGAGGIAVAASLKARKPALEIAIIDPADVHYYQPGRTMVGSLIHRGVTWIKAAVAAFEPHNNAVILDGCRVVKYDRLVACSCLKFDWCDVESLVETLGRNGVTSNHRYDLAPCTQ